jgi:hypothetical protein
MINIKVKNNLDKIINNLDKVNIEIQSSFSEVAMSKGDFIKNSLNEQYSDLFEGSDITMVPDTDGLRISIRFEGKNYYKFVNGYRYDLQEMASFVNGLVTNVISASIKTSLSGRENG